LKVERQAKIKIYKIRGISTKRSSKPLLIKNNIKEEVLDEETKNFQRYIN